MLLTTGTDLRINEYQHFLFRLMTNYRVPEKMRMIIDTGQEHQIPAYASFV